MAEEQVAAFVLAEADLSGFVVDHYDRLLRLARLLCRDGSDAGDAVQRALEQAWRKRATLRDDDRLRSWLDRIVVREAIHVARARESRLRWLVSTDAKVGWTEPADPRSDSVPELTGLRDAYRRLPADQRAAVALHLYMGYPVEQCAHLVGAPVETVRSRLRLAKDRLRRELREGD